MVEAAILSMVLPAETPVADAPGVVSVPLGADRTAKIFPLLVRMYTPFGVLITRTVSPAGIFCGPVLLAALEGMLMSENRE